jgi:hypothetical protein
VAFWFGLEGGSEKRLPHLRRPIAHIGGGRRSCAAEESSAHFDSVPNDPALAVLANRGHRLNRTLEAVGRGEVFARTALCREFLLFGAKLGTRQHSLGSGDSSLAAVGKIINDVVAVGIGSGYEG